MSFVCWKDISTMIVGEYFWNTSRDSSKYVLSSLKQFAELLNQVFVSAINCSYQIIFIKNLDRVLTDLLEESFKSKISMRCDDYSNASIFISLYCNFSLTHWVGWVTQYWNQGHFKRNKIYFHRAVPSGKALLIAVSKGFALLQYIRWLVCYTWLMQQKILKNSEASPELRAAFLHRWCRIQRQQEKSCPLFIQAGNSNSH